MFLILLVLFVWSYCVFLRSEYEGSCRIYVICVCLRIVVSTTYCVVYLCIYVLFVFVLCTQCYQCLWIVHSWLPLLFSYRVLCTQCCQYLWIFPSVFSNVYFRSVSCVTGVANVWIVHSWLPTRFSLKFIFVLCLVYPVLPVSLDCPFLIAPSVFSNVYWPSLLKLFLLNRHDITGIFVESGVKNHKPNIRKINLIQAPSCSLWSFDPKIGILLYIFIF